MSKLYVVVRGDLRPGQQAAQLVHAAREFAADHPEIEERWFRESNRIVLLEAPNEDALAHLHDRAREADIPASQFIEPDLGNSLTAIAIGPSGSGLVSNLPLALRAVAQVLVAER